MPTTSYSNWDFYNYHVQQDVIAGQYISAESTLVAAGPPEISPGSVLNTGATQSQIAAVYPIGLLETVGLQQSKQLQRIFEIGSSRSYFVPGRVIGSISIGRTFYFGPSLLRVLYAYYKNTTNAIPVGTKEPGTTAVIDGYTVPDPEARLMAAADPMHHLRKSPGHGYLFIDLASDLFSQPTGMAVYFKDINFVSVGGVYLENVYVQGHQMNVSSGSILIMEGASMQYDRLVPIKLMT